METFSLSAILLVGLMSSVHCLSMCGAISGALTLSLATEIRADRRRLLHYLLSYNVGRMVSYALAGALFGALGAGLVAPIHGGHWVLQTAAGILLLGTGLYLGGWFPAFARLESLGAPLWRLIAPLGHRLLPVRSPIQALLFGMAWGWLPCGLVYTALAYAVTAGSAAKGALVMICFGLGTLPAVTGAGIMTGWTLAWVRQPTMKKIAAVVIILLALASLWVPTPKPASFAAVHPHTPNGT